MAKKPIRVYKKAAGSIVVVPKKQVYSGGTDVDRLSITQQVISHPDNYALAEAQTDNPNYESLLHSIYDAVVITDTGGTIRETNKRAEQSFLLESSELHQMNVVDLISGADKELLKVIGKNVTNKKYTVLEAVCVRGDESRFQTEIVINRLADRDEKTLCFFIRDITVRKEAEEELRQANEMLVEAEKVQARVDTLSTLFYELNNPLQILSCMAELDENKEYKKQIGRIVSVLDALRKEESFEPVVDEDGKTRYDISAQADLEECDRKKMLVVDDEKVLRDMFVNAISQTFPYMEVDSAADGQEAIDIFNENHHSLIIMDISMPVMNGEQAFEKIEELCRSKNLKPPAFIFCTGFVISDNLKQIAGGGSYHSCLSKPLTMGDLVEAVRSRLSNQ